MPVTISGYQQNHAAVFTGERAPSHHKVYFDLFPPRAPNLSTQHTTLQQLLANDTPLIDVRAPVEFENGAFPSAVNLPILNNDERREVGICYRQDGPAAAREVGHKLVSGDLRQSRVQAWLQFHQSNKGALLYCFRGGDRSRIACEWLRAEGIDQPRIEGGYKAMRQALLAVYSNLPSFLVVSGKTGSGKTLFLKNVRQAIDLEGIANHRGSAFGAFLDDQPAQIDFENRLAIDLLKQDRDQQTMIEDEGRLIGRIHLPVAMQDALLQSPLLVIEDELEQRASRIHQEYVVEQSAAYITHYGEQGLVEFEAYLLRAVDAIRKRLGGKLHAEVRELVTSAVSRQGTCGDSLSHLAWIRILLRDYYDPMYEYQLESRQDKIIARGSHQELLQWCHEQGETFDG